jgi:immune inhibitor A
MKIGRFSRYSIPVAIVAGISAMAFTSPLLAVGPDDQAKYVRVDDRLDPKTQEQRALRQQAVQAKLMGKAHGKTHEVARGQFVELEREGEDPVWTVIGEFGDFSHNNIVEPDRNYDNTTLWTEDFSRDYYLDLLFAEGDDANSMRQFYIENSANRYTVHGDVTDWALAPNDACTYDDDISYPSDPDDPDYDPNYPDGGNAVWYFIKDTINEWYATQIAAGKTPAEINEYLAGFDIWDRYDGNGNGDFDEPDGYIDHVNFVHAGEGNEAGGGDLGDCAIWSHSWYAFVRLWGDEGPDGFLQGGLQIGGSDFWVGKYIINPENGGVGVFAHEYGHDLDLPDLYDTSGGENSTGFWTLMSSGSWLNQDGVDIGSQPNHMGAWEKFQLGWLNYEVAFAGSKSEHKMGPSTANTKQAQGLFVVLPPKLVNEDIGGAYAGEYYYYSGAGDDLENMMYKAFSLPAGATLRAMVRYQIEVDYDYAYVIVSTDGGDTWQTVETDHSTTTDPNGENFGFGITGNSIGWKELNADLPAGDVMVGFQYWTDANTGGYGFKVDNIEITGQPLDGAESDAGWTFAGFRVTDGLESAFYNHYYLAAFRQYRGYDMGLELGPYNFGFQDDPLLAGLHVERFPYQDGLLINYWDTSERNNQVFRHPGRGLLLPIDAHPAVMYRADGGVWRNRVQTYDSTFGLQSTDALTLHWLSQSSYHPSLPAVPVFDDNNQYWNPDNPWGGVINPITGTQIKVKSISTLGGFMQIEVRPSK